MFRPLFRNASSRRRVARVSKLNFVASMMDGSGLKVILVPVFLPALPALASGALGMPARVFLLPGGRRRARFRAAALSESAFTQLTPTPCRPPETL